MAKKKSQATTRTATTKNATPGASTSDEAAPPKATRSDATTSRSSQARTTRNVAAKQARSNDRNRWVLIGAGVVLVVVAAAAVWAFTQGGSSAPKPRSFLQPTPVVETSQQVSVDVVDTAYKPAVIQVKPGTTVTWHFKGNVAHTVTSVPGTGPIPPTASAGATPAPAFRFDSGGRPKGKTFAFTFDTPGTYNYYCTIHHVMEGTVIVTDGTDQSLTPTAPATPAATPSP